MKPALAASPEIISRLANRPRAFFAVGEFFNHVRFLFHAWKWKQLIFSLGMFVVLAWTLPASYEAIIFSAFGRDKAIALLISGIPYFAFGFVIGPLFEEAAKLLSIRTEIGGRNLGAGFALLFPILEMALLAFAVIQSGHNITLPFIILRLIGVTLHLYTHFIQSYQLSIVWNYKRNIFSFVTAILVHLSFNITVSLFGIVLTQ